jgi:excisionase family DNA binding protein
MKPKRSLRELLQTGDLIAPEELAAGLGIARVTVYAWARRGKIPYLKFEGVVRFEPEEIAQWLKTKRQAGGMVS